MKTIKGVFNVANDMLSGEKELKLKVNKYGQSLGFNEIIISSILKNLFQKAEIGKMFKKGKLVKIKAEIINKDNFQTLKNLYINIPGSLKKVRLSEVVDFIYKPSYTEIYKDNGKKIRTVQRPV